MTNFKSDRLYPCNETQTTINMNRLFDININKGKYRKMGLPMLFSASGLDKLQDSIAERIDYLEDVADGTIKLRSSNSWGSSLSINVLRATINGLHNLFGLLDIAPIVIDGPGFCDKRYAIDANKIVRMFPIGSIDPAVVGSPVYNMIDKYIDAMINDSLTNVQ